MRAQPKKAKAGSRPILSHGKYGVRGQVDLIDYQSSEYAGYRFLLTYVDHGLKLGFTFPLPNKQVHLSSCKLTAGGSSSTLLHAVALTMVLLMLKAKLQVVTAMKDLWPGCTMVTGRPRHSPSNGGSERFNRTIEQKVRLFCCEHNTPNWPVAAHLVAWQYNTSFHSAIQQVPYVAVFGQVPRVGQQSLRLSDDLANSLTTEADLNAALGLPQDKAIDDDSPAASEPMAEDAAAPPTDGLAAELASPAASEPMAEDAAAPPTGGLAAEFASPAASEPMAEDAAAPPTDGLAAELASPAASEPMAEDAAAPLTDDRAGGAFARHAVLLRPNKLAPWRQLWHGGSALRLRLATLCKLLSLVHGSRSGQRIAGQPTGSGGAAERPDLLELAQSGRVGAKSVSAEDDYLAVPELLQRAESGYEAVRPVSRVPGLFPLSTDLTNEYLKQDDRRLPAQEEYLWMSCFGAHMAALFVALDELLPYVPATNLDFTPYLARARNHAEAIDKAFRFRLAFLRRLNEIKRVHARKQPLLLEWWLQLPVAGVGEDVVVDVGVAAKDAFGSDELDQRTLDLLSSSLSAQTLKSYAGRLSQFAEFCHDSENISPLEATTATVVRYVAWIGERGHIAAKSLQPYLSAINTFFELHNLDPIAKDSLHLTSARRGLMLRQRRLDAAPLRVPLPADVAYRFVTKAELIVSAPYPEYHHNFRALLASVVNFMFFARGLTGVSCRVRDVHVDDYNITLQVYREKGRAGRRDPTTFAYFSFRSVTSPSVAASLAPARPPPPPPPRRAQRALPSARRTVAIMAAPAHNANPDLAGEAPEGQDFANYFCTRAPYFPPRLSQKDMLEDHKRTGAYFNSVMQNRAQFEGKVVLDVGTGSGILAIFAAKAGAKKVYAVEATDMAKFARQVVEKNGLSDVITVIQGMVESVQIPEKVDIIISEWMGYYLLRESMLDSVLLARDKFMKPGGAMYPSHARMYYAPIRTNTAQQRRGEYHNLLEGWGEFESDMMQNYGVDLSCLGSAYDQEQRDYYIDATAWQDVHPSQMVGQPVCFKEFDLNKVQIADIQNSLTASCTLPILESGPIQGLCSWFDVQFRGSEENPADEEVLLTTGPDATGATHWGQQTFFMHPEIEAAQGDSLRLKLLIERKKENHRLMRVTITHKLQGTSDMARSASEETRVFHIE
eukprot:jgi/Tetstr1/460243/TSEL_000478.t2